MGSAGVRSLRIAKRANRETGVSRGRPLGIDSG